MRVWHLPVRKLQTSAIVSLGIAFDSNLRPHRAVFAAYACRSFKINARGIARIKVSSICCTPQAHSFLFVLRFRVIDFVWIVLYQPMFYLLAYLPTYLLIDSAHSVVVYYFLSLTLSACLSVCLSRYFKSILLFLVLDGIDNRSIFGCPFSIWHSTKLFLWFFI